jgi:hypothetical protein
MKNYEDAFLIWHIRMIKLRQSKPTTVKQKRRIMILIFILRERIDNVTCGGCTIDKDIFSLNGPVWG